MNKEPGSGKVIQYWKNLTGAARVLVVSSSIAALSFLYAPMPAYFIGTAISIAAGYFFMLRLVAHFKLMRFAGLSVFLLLSASFAYLRTYPFNPTYLPFWSMIVMFVSLEIATMALLTLAYKPKWSTD